MSWWANWRQVVIAVTNEGEPLQQNANGQFSIGTYAHCFYSDYSADKAIATLDREEVTRLRLVPILLPPDSECARALNDVIRVGVRSVGWVVLMEDFHPIVTLDDESATVFLTTAQVHRNTAGMSFPLHIIQVMLPPKYVAAANKKATRLCVQPR